MGGVAFDMFVAGFIIHAAEQVNILCNNLKHLKQNVFRDVKSKCGCNNDINCYSNIHLSILDENEEKIVHSEIKNHVEHHHFINE